MMLLTLHYTKRNLINTLLASSVLVCTIAYTNTARAVLAPVGAATTAAGGNAGFDFDVDNGTLTVPDTIAVGNTLTVSIDNTTGVVNSTVIFQGSSAVSGSIG